MADTKDNVIILGKNFVPESGVLIIPNFLSFHDLLLLENNLKPRSVTYLIEEDALFDPLLQAHLEKDGVAALEFSCRAELLDTFKRQIHANITASEIVIFVPGQAATRAGGFTSVPSRLLQFVVECGAPILPLFIDHPDDARLAIETTGKVETIVFSFGKVIEREAANLPNYQESLLFAGSESFNSRPGLSMHLGYALLMGLKKHGHSNKVYNGYDGDEFRFDKLLAVAIVLSKYIRQETDKDRVAIVLPPSPGALIANIAVLFAGKIPVNLNFTAGEAAILSSMTQAGIDRIITADPFVRRTQRFPWPPNKQLIFLERVLPKLKSKIIFWMIMSKFMSASAIAKTLKLPKKAPADSEAVLLFTSGSSGDPKGVALSHRNIIANVNQFSSRLQLKSIDSALGCLPLFHSFGCTVTMWYPVIEGVNLVTYPTPLEAAKLAELIEKHRISLLLSTPTFLRGYLRKAKREQLASLKLVVTGAEKLPAKIGEEFERKFGKPVFEGYGLTETSPATNLNLPDPDDPHDERIPVIQSHRPGSVGQMLPGVAVRITDPETDEPRSLHESGMIWLKGANIFGGYLNQPELTKEVLISDWLRTGDIGRVDRDMFLFIEGRMSRFSKIGGEMVPHETIETAINAELGVDTDADRKVAVVGLPDEAKGEQIVLLSAIGALDVTDLRYRLLEKGMSTLWIPKKIIEVHEIPILASGKLNLKECQEIAARGGEEI
ncbi:MAG: acyl-[acyl-carrier-protein]-phospholipid O-acyltransferase [Verrucomicrobiales bacterium]|jgi:acyl-[acyl-carrier-protein]-phospholipid O-acyltransferase/long-chain-fatty-acid--[acyl-carrier-protein] ligase